MADLRSVSVQITTRCPSIHVQRGEFHTVWLGSFDDPTGRTQVELSVLPDGTRRICIPEGAPVVVTTFQAVYETPARSPEGKEPTT